MDIKKVTVELARPRGNFPGRVETSYYTVNDGTVTLVEENGVPVDRFKFSRKLSPDGDARGLACAMTRARAIQRAMAILIARSPTRRLVLSSPRGDCRLSVAGRPACDVGGRSPILSRSARS
jgi:hypothetical protein